MNVRLKIALELAKVFRSWLEDYFTKKKFDIRDVHIYGGLAMLGYGLYIWKPCIAFSVCGIILMAMGYIMTDPTDTKH